MKRNSKNPVPDFPELLLGFSSTAAQAALCLVSRAGYKESLKFTSLVSDLSLLSQPKTHSKIPINKQDLNTPELKAPKVVQERS